MRLKKLWFTIHFSCVTSALVPSPLGSREAASLTSVRIVTYGGRSDVNKECSRALFRLVSLLKTPYSRGTRVGATLSEKRGLKFQANFFFHLQGVNILSSTYNWNSVHEVYRKGIKSVTYRIFSRINLNFGKSTTRSLLTQTFLNRTANLLM